MVWGWRNYGGIHRDIALLGTPLLYIRDVTLSSVAGRRRVSYRLTMAPQIEGALDSLVRIGAADKKAVLGVQVEVVESLSGMIVAAQSALTPLAYADGHWTGGQDGRRRREPSSLDTGHTRSLHGEVPARTGAGQECLGDR